LETDDNDNDDNNGNGGNGHNCSDGDSSGGGREYHRTDPPVIPGNLHLEAMFEWNGINEEIANGVDEHTTMGPIGNMHVNEDAPVRSIKRAYDRADEESNDDDYDEVANQYGTKNGNTHGHNGDGNDRGKDGATGTAVGGNNDAASVGSGDGGSYNVP
jgi:hypothetical protein